MFSPLSLALGLHVSMKAEKKQNIKKQGRGKKIKKEVGVIANQERTKLLESNQPYQVKSLK